MNSDPSRFSGRSQPESARPVSSILLVNDDPDTVFLMEHALRRAFPETKMLTANDGREALAIWQHEPVSAIVTDNRMPHVSGVMLTKAVRETDLDLPVIMVTAAAEIREEALRAGVTLFCPDCDMDGIVDAVKLCLGCA